jgi:transposase
VRKTWSPRGQTPVHRHRYRHDRISAISAISVSVLRRHCALYCHLYPTNIKRDEVCAFLCELLRHLRGHVIVLLDNANIHKGGPLVRLCARFPRLHLEALPPYAPELNPDEGVWTHVKRSLANSRPDDQDDLFSLLTRHLRTLSTAQSLLRGCVKHAGLSLFP